MTTTHTNGRTASSVASKPPDAELVEKIKAVMADSGIEAVRSLLKRYGAKSAGAVAPEARQAVLDELDALMNSQADLLSLLRSQHRFCRWRREATPGGHPTKKPDQSTVKLGQCRTWEQVRNAPCSSEQGIGFIFTNGVFAPDGSQLFGLDLDACRDPKTGKIESWADEIRVQMKNPFTVISPSGSGLHIFGLADPAQLEGLKAKAYVPHPAAPNTDKRPELQLFTVHGYMTMNWLGGAS